MTQIQEQELKELREIVVQYNKAAEKFMDKVESGWARSRETYKELKAAYNRATGNTRA